MLEAVEESGFFGDLVASLFDQISGGFVDVIWVHHTSVQGIKFTADGEDAFLEAGLVFIDHVGGDIEIEFVADQSKTQTTRLTLAIDDAANTGEFGGENLIVVDQGIVAIEEIPFLAFLGWEFLQEGANFGDNGDKIIELGGGNFVVFKTGGPLRSDKEAVGPTEGLPDGFGDKGGERMEHLQNHLESDFEKRKILVNLLAL